MVSARQFDRGLFRDGRAALLATDGTLLHDFTALPRRHVDQQRPIALGDDRFAIPFGSNWQSLLVDGIAFVDLQSGQIEQPVIVEPADTLAALSDGTIVVVRDGTVSTVASGTGRETPLISVEDDEDVVIVAGGQR